MELSIDEGYYDSFPGSPFSMGILQQLICGMLIHQIDGIGMI